MENNFKYIVYCAINFINNKIYISTNTQINKLKIQSILDSGVGVYNPYRISAASISDDSSKLGENGKISRDR